MTHRHRIVLGLVLATWAPHEGQASEPPSRNPTCAALATTIDRINVHRDRDPLAAEPRYRDVVEQATAEGCVLEGARAVNGLGAIALVDGRLVDALDHFETARVTAARDSSGTATNAIASTLQHNLAATYLRLGWLDEAGDALRRTAAIDRRDGVDAEDRASTLLELSRVLRLGGDVDAARETITEALAIDDATSPTTRAPLLEEAAWVAADAGRLDDAVATLEQALALLEPTRTGSNVETPVPPPHAVLRADLESDLAELNLRLGHPARALVRTDRATGLLQAHGGLTLDLEAHIQHVRALALDQLGQADAARQAANAGLLLLDATRDTWRDLGLGFFARRRTYVRHRLDLAAKAGDAHDAWAVVEQHRSRGLLSSLANRAIAASSPPPRDPDHDGDLQILRRQLIEAVRAIDTLPLDPPQHRAVAVARLRHLRTTWLRMTSRPTSVVGHSREATTTVTPTQALTLLGDDPLVLSFAEGETHWHVLALDRSGLTMHIVTTPRPEIEAAVTATLQSLGGHATTSARISGEDRLDSKLNALGRALLTPVIDRLATADGTARRVFVATEGALAGLPFEALPHPATGRPLVERHAVTYLPSFAILDTVRRRADACSRPTRSVLAVGDPVFGDRDPRWPATLVTPRTADESLQLTRLTGSAEEARAIAALYNRHGAGNAADGMAPDARATLMLGVDAHRRAVLDAAPHHRVLHWATHARTDLRVPQRSKLALSCLDVTGALDDCDVYLPEIGALELCGPLVVLSACATAAGPSVAGEGTLGLSRAFLRAGAGAVVTSRWPVSDTITARLMVAFHEQLLATEDPAEALRHAQAMLHAEGQSPRHWAAFSLFGDPRSPF